MNYSSKLAVLSVCAAANTAFAGPLLNGGSGAPPVVAFPAASTLVAEMQSAFSTTGGGNTIDGKIISSVWHTPADAFGPAGYTFVYQVVQSGNPPATSSIASYTVAGFLSSVNIVDYGQETGAGKVAGTSFHLLGTEQALLVDRPFNEDKLNVLGTGIAPGEEGYWMWFRTDVLSYSLGTATVQDGVSQHGLPVFVPIPLPAGSGMAGAGLACLFGVGYIQRRRRRNG